MATRVSPAVYRRRRLVVFGGLAVLLAAAAAVVWFALAQAQDGGAAKPPPASSSGAPTPDASQATPSEGATSPAPGESPTADALGPCEQRDVRVEAVTDSETYESDALPEMSISLTNIGGRDCTIDVGTSTQVFSVASGSDVWWRSTDCQQSPASMIVTLAAGTTVTSAEPVVWDRTRSSVDTCELTERPRAPGGGASYHVSVSIGGFASSDSVQILLY